MIHRFLCGDFLFCILILFLPFNLKSVSPLLFVFPKVLKKEKVFGIKIVLVSVSGMNRGKIQKKFRMKTTKQLARLPRMIVQQLA